MLIGAILASLMAEARHTGLMTPSQRPDDGAPEALLLHVRVKPGASRDRVGGRYGDSDPAVLVVAVQARAVEGAANRAVLALVARALGVRRADVTVLSGARHRSKVLSVRGASPELTSRWRDLLAGG